MEDGKPRRRLRKGAVYRATAAELLDLDVDPEASALGAAALRLATELDSAVDTQAAASAGTTPRLSPPDSPVRQQAFEFAATAAGSDRFAPWPFLQRAATVRPFW